MSAGQPLRSAVVFGARNLGRAVIELLTAEGWAVVGVARSQATLDRVARTGAVALEGDITAGASVQHVLERAAAVHGRVDLVVNAAAPYGGDRSGPFGGGPLSEAPADAFEQWAAAPARAAFTFLSTAGAFLLAQGGPATVIQVTGGSARRAMPGRGLWAAGSFGVRALANAAALELREHGIHVALLIVDAGIEPIDGARPRAGDRNACRSPCARGIRHVPRRAGRPERNARTAGHPARRAMGALTSR